MPALAQELQTRFNSQDDALRLLVQQNEAIQTRLGDIATGRAPVPVRVTVDFSDGSNHTVTGINSSNNVDEEGDSVNVISSVSTSSATIDTVANASSSIDPVENQTGAIIPSTAGHRWSAGVCTITDLWREYTVGLGGGLAIRELNQINKNWFPSNHKTYHYRRMRIIEAIKKYANINNINNDTAVKIAERRRVDNKFSINHLGKNISDLFTN